MNRNEIIEKINSLKSGAFVRVKYKTELPVNASSKKEGVKMWKVVSTTVRTGVEYKNIFDVIKRKSMEEPKPERTYTNPYEWEVKNRIKKHVGSGKEYFYVARVNEGHNTSANYFCETPSLGILNMGKSIDEKVKDFLIPSYFNQKIGNAPEVMQVAFENIISIE